MTRVTYEEFVERVTELGFLFPPDKTLKGFPTMDDFVPQGQWWTNDPELDPWLWKDRVAEEKRLAYGTFFNGKKGYIAPTFYSIFQDAFRPQMSMEERWQSGRLGVSEWKFWNLLTEENRPVGTHEYRKILDDGEASSRSALDAAAVQLQMSFDVAITGNVDMLDKNGQPYNKAVAYDKADNWVPAEWRSMNPLLEHQEALERIYARTEQIGQGLDRNQVQKMFVKLLRTYQRFA